MTWADDGSLYSSWGDGGGFGGSDSLGRVSLGFARIEGGPRRCSGDNVWGGLNPGHPARFEGKSDGIVCVGGTLYAWIEHWNPGHRTVESQLAWSKDHGAAWHLPPWAFDFREGFTLPALLNFGRDYRGARDRYVYAYSVRPTWGPGPTARTTSGWDVYKPGRVDLFRAPRDALLDRSRYEFFAGRNAEGGPIWSSRMKDRRPVFADPNGVGWCVGVAYDAGLKRYLLSTEHTATCAGDFGLFDAPEPWGPWTTVAYLTSWGKGRIQLTTFNWNFTSKWMSADGTHFTLIFSGTKSNDSFNTVAGTFIPAGVPPGLP
ncbi:MAG: hypothetical protein ACREFX_09920 [Opitutaceae bacterium]